MSEPAIIRRRATRSTARLALALSIFAITVAPAAADAVTQDKRLRILVTNDDGFYSKGILALTENLAQLGDVLAVAPTTDQSGSSQSTHILKGETWVTPHYRGSKLIGYEVEGTPSDAVRFGIKVLGAQQPFDFVVSGINEGINSGHINLYSGTVGAAMEALLHGVPALAVSQSKDQETFELSARVAMKVIQQMVLRGAPKDVLLSINVPAGQIRGITTRPIGGLILRSEEFRREAIDGERERYSSRLGFEATQPRGSDSEAFLRRFVTITPIRLDRTDYKTLRDLQNWDLTLPETVPAP